MTNYFFTIGWEGNGDDGEVTFARGTYQQMLDGVTEYLDKYSHREAFLACCAKESGYRNERVTEDLTDRAKTDLNIGD